MQIEPALTVAFLWLVFGGLHVGLASRRVRAALVDRLGEHGFVVFFSVVASVTFAIAIAYFAAHRTEGAPGPALGADPAMRWPLIAMIVVGVALMADLSYIGSPYDVLAHRVRPPRGLESITRHPFFMGLGMFAIAHSLLAPRLVATVLFVGIALLAIGGAYHQDRKLLARLGRPYADYLASTSAVPFAAVLTGRQRFPWQETPRALAIGIVLSMILRAVHDSLFIWGGAPVIAGTVGGAALLTWQSMRHARRGATRVATATVRP